MALHRSPDEEAGHSRIDEARQSRASFASGAGWPCHGQPAAEYGTLPQIPMGSHAILILCLLLPLAISPWAFDDAYYLKETFLLLAGGGLLFGEAMALWRGYTKWVSLPAPLLLFLAFGLASVWQVTNVWAFTFRLALLLAGVAVFIAAARSASPSDLLTALGIAGATATGYGVIQRLGLDPILAPDARFIATFGNPQLYAEFVAPLLPAALCLALVVRGRRSTATAAAGLGFLFTGLLWARVRGPALAAIIALGFLLWALARSCPGLIQHRRKRLLACAGILAGVAILMALTGNIVVWKTWAPPARPDSSRSAAAVTPGRPASTGDLGADFRLAVYRDTLAMIREKPLTGFGLGNFRIGYPAFGKSLGSAHPEMGTEVTPVGHVHNDVLEVAAELGLPGAVVFLWMFLCFIWAGLKAAQALRPEEAWPRLAAGAGLVALAVNSLFAFGFYDPAAGLELWVFAGIAMAPVAGTIASETPEIARRSV